MNSNVNITNIDDLSIYLKEIKKIPMMTDERFVEVCNKLLDNTISKKERKNLQDELVLSNLRFVVSVAKKYQNQGLGLSDLINEGNLGLIKASEEFDPSVPVKFISYAVHWIRQSIMSSLDGTSRIIRLPSNIIQDQQKQNKINFDPDDDEFYDKINTFDNVSIPKCVSLDISVNEDGTSLGEIIPNTNIDNTDHLLDSLDERKKHVRMALKILTDKERIIIEKYYGLCGVESNLKDLGEEFGCTKERIRQLKEKSLRKLRNESFNLLKYL
jgi:RNA polymerase primary sigma factor